MVIEHVVSILRTNISLICSALTQGPEDSVIRLTRNLWLYFWNLRKTPMRILCSPWPVHFDVRKLPDSSVKPKKTTPKRNSDIPTIFIPLVWIIAHTIGIRLTYVGCTWIFNSLTCESDVIISNFLLNAILLGSYFITI
ncbi:unnamed protein product [Schistosoma turkestanicum]|nr:unnamed protein product [Schistosoma turkestanicum]